MQTINAQSVAQSSSPFILDVRTAVEYRAVHVPNSILHPLHTLDAAKVRELAGDKTVYVMCRSGNRATQAAEKLNASGVSNVEVIEGGIQSWQSAGLPVNRGQAGMSIERQVRVAAGSLVLAGVLLAAFVNPLFIILSGFVGCGLIFAGLTDWCGMGMLLARMPWNNVEAASGSSCCAAK
jgi:rhodanese-related sulfurtransferase